MSNGAKNSVIAYGMDEFGNYMPLNASSVPDNSSFLSLPRLTTDYVLVDGTVGASIDIALPGVVEDTSVFVHGFYILCTEDSNGEVPLNQSEVSGLFDNAWYGPMHFIAGNTNKVAPTGQMGDFCMLTQSNPSIESAALPGTKSLRFVGGFIPMGVLIRRYIDGILGRGVRVTADPGGAAFMGVSVVYSVVGGAV